MRRKPPAWPDASKGSQQISSSARTLPAALRWGGTETCSRVWRPCPAHRWQPAVGPWVPWGRRTSGYFGAGPPRLYLHGPFFPHHVAQAALPPPSSALAWDVLPNPTAVRQGNAPVSALTCASVHSSFPQRAPLRRQYQAGQHTQPLAGADAGACRRWMLPPPSPALQRGTRLSTRAAH